MKTGIVILVGSALFAVSCFAGDLEKGVALHERKDYASALKAFGKAAASGNAEAQRRLGFMYYHGEGVAQGNKRALALFEKAAKTGDVESARNLGTMYEHGMSVDQNDALAASWYTVAAELGEPNSQFAASVTYYKGQGVARDRIEAAKWWNVAMSQGPVWERRIRPMIDSAEAKLSAEENAEGKRRAAEWLSTHNTRK
ncbi:MAG: tetratricopeptide repeat protein [Betaproteobacteria bacterium]